MKQIIVAIYPKLSQEGRDSLARLLIYRSMLSSVQQSQLYSVASIDQKQAFESQAETSAPIAQTRLKGFQGQT